MIVCTTRTQRVQLHAHSAPGSYLAMIFICFIMFLLFGRRDLRLELDIVGGPM